MTKDKYTWTDNPTVSGKSVCDTDILNDCLMHLKYEKRDGGTALPLFTPMFFDHVLTGEEALGWALQGSTVTKSKYPTAYAKIVELYENGGNETYRGIECRRAIDGRYIADSTQAQALDKLFVTTGVSDFYILDTTNENFLLPKNNYFIQATDDSSNLNKFNEAGLPNITGTFPTASIWGGPSGAFAFTGGTGEQDGDGDGSRGRTESFDAARCSSVYGKSNTVQPPSSSKLLYYRVGDTVINADEALIEAKEIYETTKVKIADETEAGVQRLSQVSNAITYNQISNCILELPSPINLSLTDGTLTLKSGSTVTIPNGFEEDETTRKYHYLNIENDISCLCADATTNSYMLYLDPERSLKLVLISECSSAADNTVTAQINMRWNTTENLISYTNNTGETWTGGYSIPLGIINCTAESGITSIAQVFNGIGYMGNIVWADKGIRSLVSAGMNKDNTLYSIEFLKENFSFDICEAGADNLKEFLCCSDSNIVKISSNNIYFQNDKPSTAVHNAVWYCPFENKHYIYDTSSSKWKEFLAVPIFEFSKNANGTVTKLINIEPFRAFSYQDRASLTGFCIPDWKRPEGRVLNTVYIADKDGFVYGDISTSASGFLSTIIINSNVRLAAGNGSSGNWGKSNTIIAPVSKGDTYQFTNSWSTIWFLPCKGVI